MKCYPHRTCTPEIRPWSIHQITVQFKQNHVCIAGNRAVSIEAGIWIQAHLRNADTCSREVLIQSRWDLRQGREAALEFPPSCTKTDTGANPPPPPPTGAPHLSTSAHCSNIQSSNGIRVCAVCQMLYGKHGGVEPSKTLEAPPLKALYSLAWERDACWRNIGMKQIGQTMVLIFSGKGTEG